MVLTQHSGYYTSSRILFVLVYKISQQTQVWVLWHFKTHFLYRVEAEPVLISTVCFHVCGVFTKGTWSDTTGFTAKLDFERNLLWSVSCHQAGIS